MATPTGKRVDDWHRRLTLGGGLGWIARKHGSTCDNLFSANLVTAAGELVKASADEKPDLFWGLPEGAGNFGVVTSFEYCSTSGTGGPRRPRRPLVRPRAGGPSLLRRLCDHRAGQVVGDRVDFQGGVGSPLPAELHGQAVIALAVCYAGDLDEGERALRPLRAFGRRSPDAIAPMLYTQLQSSSDAAYRRGCTILEVPLCRRADRRGG